MGWPLAGKGDIAMWLVFLVMLVMFIPFLASYLSGSGGRAGMKLLQTSFLAQRARVHGRELPATDLIVVHRWRANAATDRSGAILTIDANWLCRTRDGLYVLAIGQGGEGIGKILVPFGAQAPLEIQWIWRSLSEERVRHMLAATPRIYRKVFAGSGR